MPPAYQSIYDELKPKLEQLIASVDEKWDGTKSEVFFCSDLSICNTQIQKTRLLTPGYYALTVQMMDALVDMGMKAVRFNFSYPFLVTGFPESDRYLDLFGRIVQAAKARNMTVFIKCTSTNTNPDYGAADPAVDAFMNQLTSSRYKTEKRQMIETIIQILRPDYLTVEDEPETMEAATGLVYTPDSLENYIAYFLDGLDKAGCRIGAGVGSWEPRAYVDRLVEIPGLDYLDIHVYPVNLNFVDDNLFYIQEKAEAFGKPLVFGECWLNKTGIQDIGSDLTPVDRFKRDVFGFWFPLDSLYTRLLADFAYYSDAEIVTLYWTSLFFNTLEYQDGYKDLSADSLYALTIPQALENMQNRIFSPIGRFYRDIITEAAQTPVIVDDRSLRTASTQFELRGNYPNPFNSETTIRYTVTGEIPGPLEIALFNHKGERVKTLVHGVHAAGDYQIRFSGYRLPSGLYICRILAENRCHTRKMLLLK